MTRRQSQPHYSADSDLNAEMITWASTEFTQIRWKRHFDVKLWVGTFYPRIFHTRKQCCCLSIGRPQRLILGSKQNRV